MDDLVPKRVFAHCFSELLVRFIHFRRLTCVRLRFGSGWTRGSHYEFPTVLSNKADAIFLSVPPEDMNQTAGPQE